jgi:glycine/D-amino acid oxidase-like deaminating enzyme
VTIIPNRRAFLAASAGALTVSGCATTLRTGAVHPQPTGPCLPPVDISPERVIRTTAGLRPYRASGFVVRAEPLGTKCVVHNYGHGGAGVTLSWGTSRLAVDLGLQGHSGPVAVLGAGIMGLSTARLVQEAGVPVTIYTAALPPDTTSNVSGGQFHPFGHFRDDAVTPEWRAQYARALDYSWRRFQIMVGEDYGVRWIPTYAQGDAPEERLVPNFPPVNRLLGEGEHPFGPGSVVRYDTLYIEPGRYLRQLLRDIRTDGGAIRVQRFDSPAALSGLPESLIFNCTGLGARDLFGDQELRPIRGQLAILLPQPEIRYAYNRENGHMFPRPDGIVIGGSWERDEWSTQVDPARIARIIERNRQIFANWPCRVVTAG